MKRTSDPRPGRRRSRRAGYASFGGLCAELLEDRLTPAALALPGSARLGLLVPAFFYPTSGGPWDQLASAAAQVPLTAILNPNSGPGSAADANYAAAVDKVRAAGGRVIGYVDTDYGMRPLADVEADISTYNTWYHLDGISLDRMTTDAGMQDVSYYQQLYGYVHTLQPSWSVVGNPGTVPDQAYISTPDADNLILFENPAPYSYTAPSWQAALPAQDFTNLVYNVATTAAMQTDVTMAVGFHAGWVYVTDGNTPNPYADLPSYWTSLVAAVAGVDEVITPAAPDLTATAAAPLNAATVATFTDNNPYASGSFTVSITWGDGFTSAGTVASSGGTFTVTGSHTYSQPGRYAVAVSIGDTTGGSATAHSIAHVAQTTAPPPPATLFFVSDSLTTSAEYYSNFVTAAYQTYLHRLPDGPGLAGWVQGMKGGFVTDEQLEAFFIGSPEYIASKGSGPGNWMPWVISMYQDLLGRTPSQSEAQPWVDGLNAGISTTYVAHGFAASPEREHDRVTADYVKYLGRTPTDTEVAQWVNAFVQGQATNEYVIAGFIGSAEYFKKHYNDDADWLFSAYHDALGRDPDAPGLAAWLGYLGGS